VLARVAVMTLLVLAGCGGDDEPAATATPSAGPSAANAYIGSIAVEPADGTVMLGTGLGLFRVENGQAERVVGELGTPDGSGQVSSNLVVSYAGPGELLGSGHPEGGGLPENLGLIRSGDHGATWEPVALLGKADFHILQASGTRVVAVNADAKEIRVSADGGRTFAGKTPPDVPVDVVFDPQDPRRMVVATKQGVFTSLDEGGSWRQRDPTATQQLAWGAPDALYRADPGGSIKVSRDGGESWGEAGNVGSPTVNELAVDATGALYAGVPGGEVKRSTDGGATWTRLVVLS
jgi:photosystem II stability/assembly factor-like uncharacterized protein